MVRIGCNEGLIFFGIGFAVGPRSRIKLGRVCLRASGPRFSERGLWA